MYKKYFLTQELEDAYAGKRRKLAGLGYETDEQVSGWFESNGIVGVKPSDVREVLLMALGTSPAQRAIRALRGDT